MIGFHGRDIIHLNQYYHLVKGTGRFMAKKGTVRRMDSSLSNSNLGAVDITDEMPHQWKRGQEHFDRFTKLIRIELDDETAMVEERWKKWSKQKLVSAGLALFELSARTQGRFFGEPIIVFEESGRNRLPQHLFSHGDIVLISRTRTWGENVFEGIGLDRVPSRV